LFYAVAAVAVVILGLSKGGFAGVGMVSTPLLALLIGPVEAAGVILPILIIQDAVAVFMYRREWRRDIVLTMAPGAIVGVWAAYELASKVPEAVVQISLGAISLVFSVRQMLRSTYSELAEPTSVTALFGVLSGAAAGFTSAIAHAGTPPFQIYVTPKKLSRDAYIGTSVIFFACLNLMKLPAFAMLGQITRDHLIDAAIFAPLAVFSSWLGVRLVRRVDVARFNFMILVILAGIGVLLIAQGAMGGRLLR
jgi:uncharacterized membrane protein YfcA